MGANKVLHISIVVLALIYVGYVLMRPSLVPRKTVESYADAPRNRAGPSPQEESYSDLSPSDFRVYKVVLDSFNKALDRYPDPKELEQFYNKVKSDETFNLVEFLSVEYNKKEHGRRGEEHYTEKDEESGFLNFLLRLFGYKKKEPKAKKPSGPSAKDVEALIIQHYTQIVGDQPEKLTVEFLTKKYHEFGGDVGKLREYIYSMTHDEVIGLGGNGSGSGLGSGLMRRESTTPPPPMTMESPLAPQPSKQPLPVKPPSTSSGAPSSAVSTTLKAPAPQAPVASGVNVKANQAPPTQRQDAKVVTEDASPMTVILQRPTFNTYYGVDAKPNALQTPSADNTPPIPLEAIKEVVKEQTASVCKKDSDVEERRLSDLRASRNMNELKYACQRGSTYLNADERGRLCPGQEWSVPQKRPPACAGGTCGVSPLMEQSSLIGTLLEEAKNTEVGSILPKFTFKVEGQ